MTILIGWLGVDSHSPCSAYLMSDSKFTWGRKPIGYDYGQKLFALNNNPDVFGYCGDVLFASQILSQIYNLDNSHLLFPPDSDCSTKSKIVFEQIERQFASYPDRHISSIYHISRDLDTAFHIYKYTCNGLSAKWKVQEIEFTQTTSSLVFSDGSGAAEFQNLYRKYQSGDITGTSRNIYQCFCSSLVHSKIPTCGGSPQLVGLYRGKKFNGLSFGIIYQKSRHFLGSPSPVMGDYNVVRWYNENFEICDGNSMERFSDAMRQPNPNH